MSGNPFDDLDGLDDDADDDAESEASSTASPSDSSSSAEVGVQRDERSTTDGSSSSQTSTDADDTDTTSVSASPSDGPAFPYDEVTQRPLYAREEAWNAFEDALELDVERTLREYDVRDAAGRELHDAALRVAAEHPEEIANQLLELRGIDVNQ